MARFEDYPVVIQPIKSGNLLCYLPDFGALSCSAVEGNQFEALTECKATFVELRLYYQEKGIEIPKPFSKIENKE